MSNEYLSPVPEDYSKGFSAEQEVSRKSQSILENVFIKAGVSSLDENGSARISRNLSGIPGVVGNETFVFHRGNPALYRVKKLYLEPKEDEKSYELKWIMDPGKEGFLNIITLTTQAGRDLLELGLQHQFNPDLYIAARYDHGYFDPSSMIMPDFSAPVKPMLEIGRRESEQISLQRSLTIGDKFQEAAVITGNQIGTEGGISEQITFPKHINDSLEWIAEFEASWRDATNQPEEPWKDWFTRLGITYQIQG